MEPGESLEEAGRREVREETGLEVGKMDLFQVFAGDEFFFIYPNGDQVYSASPIFVTNDAHGNLKSRGM